MKQAQVVALLAILCACSEVRGPPDGGQAGELLMASSSKVDSLAAAGQQLYGEGEYQAARQVWLDALASARAESRPRDEARVLTSLSLASRQLGDPAQARRLGEAAVALEREQRLDSLLPRSLNALGLLAWDQGRLAEAADLFRQTVAASRNVGDSTYVYRPSANLGLVYMQYGEFEAARRALRAALAGARANGDSLTTGRTLTNLSVIELRTGDVAAALGLLGQARAAAEEAADEGNQEIILAQLSDAYSQLGEPARAFAAVDSALRRARQQGARQAIAADLELQAALYRDAGDLLRALDLYDRARAIDDTLGLAEESARDLRNEAEIHFRLGNLARAERAALHALDVHRQIGVKPAELADLMLLAELAEARGHSHTADRRLAGARGLVRKMNARSMRVDVAIAAARILDRRRDMAGALRVLDEVKADLPAVGFALEWEAQALRARAYARMGSLERAVDAGRRAVAATERVRGNFGSEMLRSAYVADRRSAYTDLVTILLRLHRVAEAFQVADRARAGALDERLRIVPQHASHPGESTEDMMLRRIAQLAASLSQAESEGDNEAASELAARLRAARRDFEAAFVERAERQGAREPTGGAPDVARIQAALRPREALVEHLMADDRTFTFVVTPSQVRTFETNVSAGELASRVRLTRELLADRQADPHRAEAALAGLHELLWRAPKSSGALGGVERLILVTHGGLSYLPFGALHDSVAGRYLLQDYSLLYLPVAAALPNLRGRSHGDAPIRASIFAPLPAELPGSRIEARTVAEAFVKTEAYSGRRATETRLRASLAVGGMVHVASHATLSAQSPLFSRIVTAAVRQPTSEDDGRLELHEVLGLTIRSPLVFLSGCETDLGTAWSTAFATGEDYATLARAFLYAGARNVVATLWPVEDEGAAKFAGRFYQRLMEGDGPAEALAAAQRDLLKDDRYGHPYYWAAYRVAGDGDMPGSWQKAPAVSVQY